MGKGTIISGGTDGQYQVEVNFYRDKINAEISALEIRIANLTERIALMPDGPERNVVKLQRTGLEKRKDFLENNIPEDETISAWCADLSEELTGNVGTVEVPGERGVLLIQPGYEENAAYSTSRDGQLLPIIATTAEQFFYNLAMLPGWQKWKPTFRFGIIDSRDGDMADVTLEAASSSQQNIDVNQTTDLSSIPIEYMSCNGSAFEVGDEVLIKFEEQDWEQPKIVGFKDHPKPCAVKIRIEIAAGDAGQQFLVWDMAKNDYASIPDGAGGSVSFPASLEDITYWLYNTERVWESGYWNTQRKPVNYDLATFTSAPHGIHGNLIGDGEEDLVGVANSSMGLTLDHLLYRKWTNGSFMDYRYLFKQTLPAHIVENYSYPDGYFLHNITPDDGLFPDSHSFVSYILEDYEYEGDPSWAVSGLKYVSGPHAAWWEPIEEGGTGSISRSMTYSSRLKVYFPIGLNTFLSPVMVGEYSVGASVSEPTVLEDSVSSYGSDRLNYIYDVDFFESRAECTTKELVQIHCAQWTQTITSSTYDGPTKFSSSGDLGELIEGAFINEEVESENTYLDIRIGTHVAEESLIDEQYNPATGLINQELTDAVIDIINSSGGDKKIDYIALRFYE
jgi:hypothetical protein